MPRGAGTEEVKRSSLRQVLLPKELSAAAQTAHEAMLQAGNTNVEVRAYDVLSPRGDLVEVLEAIRPRLPYGTHLQVQGALDRGGLEAKLAEWGGGEEDGVHRSLLGALDGVSTEQPINENLWLSSEDAPIDDASATSSEWADWVMVFFYPKAKRVVTIRLHYEA